MELQDLNKALQACIPEHGWPSSQPILAGNPETETLYQVGTGILMRVADESFLVTAAHIAIDAEERDIALCMPTSAGSFVQLHGKWIISAEGQHGTQTDPFDIGVLRLESLIVDKISGFRFLRLTDISDVDVPKGIFALFGYPVRMSRESTKMDKDVVITPFQLITYAYSGRTDHIRGYQERFHLLLDAEPSNLTDICGQPIESTQQWGNIRAFPEDLKGISGCSVWRIARMDVPVEQWSKETPKIVGITTEIRVIQNSKIIMATKMIAVSTLLVTAFHELKPAFELFHGGDLLT